MSAKDRLAVEPPLETVPAERRLGTLVDTHIGTLIWVSTAFPRGLALGRYAPFVDQLRG